MSMTPLRQHTALAIDGGGIKGLIIAQALIALEDELGGGPLIKRPEIQIMAGTSTGAIITAAIAMGMTSADIAKVYMEMGQQVFPPLAPKWLPDAIEKVDEVAHIILQHSLYSNDRLVELLKATIKDRMGKADLTLAELNEALGPDKALILTAVNITERRTRFLKSYKPSDGDWKLWEAILASSSAPIALPVVTRDEAYGKHVYYTDGGVGNYGNPAYVVAQEAVVFRDYDPSAVTVLSFGTGWVNADNYEKAVGEPAKWRGLDWAQNAPMVIVGDAARAQSLDIIEGFGAGQIDLRRFQFLLEKDISGDAYGDDATYVFMKDLGMKLGQRIRLDQYAPKPYATPEEMAEFDPEGIYTGLLKYRDAKTVAQAHLSK
ncbi:MAG TPA: patatin-like phospholipase family protein [Anaerolineae bacterium]|nr:patatin-like phospholipase family protein [Anaerolineae bacterium]